MLNGHSQVQVKRSIRSGEPSSSEDEGHSQSVKNCDPPVVRKGKLVVVDLAGSERVQKSGAILGESSFVYILEFIYHAILMSIMSEKGHLYVLYDCVR